MRCDNFLARRKRCSCSQSAGGSRNSNAYFARDGEEELILEDVVSVEPQNGKIHLVSLFGEHRTIDAEIRLIDLIHHKIVFDKRN